MAPAHARPKAPAKPRAAASSLRPPGRQGAVMAIALREFYDRVEASAREQGAAL